MYAEYDPNCSWNRTEQFKTVLGTKKTLAITISGRPSISVHFLHFGKFSIMSNKCSELIKNSYKKGFKVILLMSVTFTKLIICHDNF